MAAACLGAAGLGLLPALVLAQGAPSLALPIACEIGKTCIVQNYVDHDPGQPGARDYRCGLLTYDGHKGTDIRVVAFAAYRQGVAVLAAAPGRVRAVRDGMPDVSVRTTGKQAIAGKEAGNSVVIEHGDGWETQYAHMRKGSIAVRAGDTVQAGHAVGVVGLSGSTEFAHLHFEVRHRGKTVDPFIGPVAGAACQPGDRPLWQQQALNALSYVATGVVDAGISGAPPKLADGSVDRDKTESLTAASGAAVFWVQIYGARAGDIEESKLFGPDGRVLAERRGPIDHNKAQWLAYVGKRSKTGWANGTYRGEYSLYRDSESTKLLSITREMRIGG